MELTCYRGDTLKFDFIATLEGENYPFKMGDTLKVGIKDKLTNSKYVAFKKFTVEEETEIVPVFFSHEETKKWSLGDKILEVELTDTDGIVTTLYQEKIKVMGDVINE